MNEVQCFWSAPLPRMRLDLRRFVWSTDLESKCPGPFGYHTKSLVIGEIDRPLPNYDEPNAHECELENIPHDDARWPKHCDCGFEFRDSDPWQLNAHRLYEGAGMIFILPEAPVGAMWDAWWMGNQWKGPDGIHLAVKTPGGEWLVDGPSANGGPGWTRNGEIPNVSASPSILMSNYHGFLTGGILKGC